jgi:hypothetical protein
MSGNMGLPENNACKMMLMQLICLAAGEGFRVFDSQFAFMRAPVDFWACDRWSSIDWNYLLWCWLLLELFRDVAWFLAVGHGRPRQIEVHTE